jgi:8-oxo-dGTP diphosphatase
MGERWVGLNINESKHLFFTTFSTHNTRQIVLLTFLWECQNDEVFLSDEHDQFILATKDDLMGLLPEVIINDYKKYNVFELL